MRGTRRTSQLTATLATAIVGLLFLAGCSNTGHGQAQDAPQQDLSEVEVLEDPRSYEGPSTAVIPDAVIEPITENPDQSLPTTVTSYTQAGGEEQIEITDTSRVVALDMAGSIAASIWALGFSDTLVGVDQSTTFAGTEDLETVTSGGHTVNAEAIIGLAPDVVITDGSVGPRDVVEQLTDVGITVVFLENESSFDGAQNLIRQVAEVYGATEVGEQLATQTGQDIEDKIAQIAEIAPQDEDEKVRMLFLYLRGNAGVYYMFGSESGADDLISALGGVDVAKELGWEGMKPMTDEALVAADPDLILTMSGGIESVDGIEGLLEEKPAVAITTAGENQRIVDMEDGQILSFGPRSADVLDALARAVYAPESADAARAAQGNE
ncbi:MAG: ABC transporter substrate-binding protein [Yaniella sp.]|uniref:heme/hemin ABC transporter substrate-binding protein n=2 Tax=Yaniella sp. TaxID=2773929 RepID=UPI002647818D|nr:ABC transporter substrate-binding protein [Yaniella sp.]MDN5705174.1 ABC transporter substrate-binding protein [Yaniella sp.]MDN5730655.1 ABC transporter substrate-binding protein [Yaniella sp.]MDN5742492.1 ABC transporter substrate-binding protein [Yaniella sp.]MDN5816186.1 ABC transporter substrate-binding protein [Yaniella sp.]MDN5817664.1 ABC transporter substrate-binding protein [Yaniella sp.]